MIKWNQKKLEKCVAFWQKVLMLQNWDITCSFERLGNLENALGFPALACVVSNPLMEEAHIKVLNPVDFDLLDDTSICGMDIEASCVHECVHLFLGTAIKDQPGEDLDEELVINRLTKILLNGYGRVITE